MAFHQSRWRDACARFIRLLIAFTAASTDVRALNLQGFIQCVGASGQGPVCQLDAGTYVISSTISISRSNITIKGTILTSRADTVLQRAPGFKSQLLRDQFSAAGTPILNSITIKDLSVDGNRAKNTDTYSSYTSELSLFSTASVLITNCDFVNSPNISVALTGAGTSGVVINNSHFGDPVIYGLWSGAVAGNASVSYLDCGSKEFVSNVIVTNSQFDNAGEPAILGHILNLQITNSVFTNNHSYPVPFDDDGGQIDLTQCASNVAIAGNTFRNASAASTGHVVTGLELHGADLTIVDNLITNNTGDSIDLQGAANVFLANWNRSTAETGNGGGLSLYQGTGPDSQRPVDFVTIDNVIVTNNAKWGLWSQTAGAPINHVTVTNSCFKNNGFGYQSLNGLGPNTTIQSNPLAGCAQ